MSTTATTREPPSPPSTISGSSLISYSLRAQNVTTLFGLIGIPVIEVAQHLIDDGVRFIGFRNEQSVGYAASAWGYLTGQPGVALVVGGPGVIHALSGVHHSEMNGWPLVLLAGSSETHQQDMGAFQELDQVRLMHSVGVKYAARPPTIEQFPKTLEKAFRYAMLGKPGTSYIDLPADYIQGSVDLQNVPQEQKLGKLPQPGRDADGGQRKMLAHPEEIKRAVDLLMNAKRPLVVIGKGAQYAQAEGPISRLFETISIPFLPTPMGKGLMPDDHPLCISAARSTALAGADVVLVLGARLNWILHYGSSPKWSKGVKFIRVEIEPEAVDDNVHAEIGLVGDVTSIVEQLVDEFAKRRTRPASTSQDKGRSFRSDDHAAWYQSLNTKCHGNSQKMIQASMIFPRKGKPTNKPLTYQQAFGLIKPLIPRSHFFISEGANTMDIARSMFEVFEPRSRLDAGTQATMGVGMGFAIAASLFAQQEYKKDPKKGLKTVVSVVGDSAFGFSAMEVETAVRNKLGMLIIVMNNGGVYKGLSAAQYAALPLHSLPPTALLPETRYEMIAEACGGKGFLVKTPDELIHAVKSGVDAQKEGVVTLINVMMEPGGEKKLEFGWLASTKPKPRL